MLDHFGRGERAKPRRSAIVVAARKPHQEARGEQVASAGGIDDALNRQRMNRISLLTRNDEAALLATGPHTKSHVGAQRVHRRVEVGGLVQAVKLALVGKDQIDSLLADEIEELTAIAINTESVRERERDQPTGAMRDTGGLEKCLLGAGRVPQI